MNSYQNFDSLISYAKSQNILIDFKEFIFQMQSHPDYPSLLAISDTLSFLDIENFSFRVAKDDIHILPKNFMAILQSDLNEPELCYIQKKDENYLTVNNVKKLTNLELENSWYGIVLFMEKTSNVESVDLKETNVHWFLFALAFSGLVAVVFSFSPAYYISFFFLFSICGILFSIVALKDLFGTKSKFIDGFCNMTSSTDCNTIINSQKWKILKMLNFSDLSIVFFSSQFIGLFLSIITNNVTSFLSIQKFLLFGALPIIIASIYFQKFVEKKWCPVCLFIMSVIIVEVFFIFFIIDFKIHIRNFFTILFTSVFSTILLLWLNLKKILTNQKILKEDLSKSYRFEQNYEIFKNTLITGNKVQLPNTPIVLGNKNSKNIISVITNPFCGHCKKVHEFIEEILEKHYNNIQIQIILKTKFESETEEGKNVFRNLMKIFKEDNEHNFMEALRIWFDKKNITEWLHLYPKTITSEFDDLLSFHQNWCEENNYNFTPAIFINGHEYPKMFERKNILVYIKHIIEDEF